MFTIKFYYILNLITQIKFSIIVPVRAVLFFASVMPDRIVIQLYFEILIAFIQVFQPGRDLMIEYG